MDNLIVCDPSAHGSVWKHHGMEAEVILASVAEDCPPLYTVRMRYPRIIHAEVMTHRVFSRNARSSRAVPVKKMIQEIRETPFVPWHWGANQAGMQAGEECNEEVRIRSFWQGQGGSRRPPSYGEELNHTAQAAWVAASERAVEIAEAYMTAGYHKQIANRLLEPFMWIDVLVTSTDWANFFHLRDHPAAEPHLQDLARLVKQAIDGATPQALQPGQWHLPYITNDDRVHFALELADEDNKIDHAAFYGALQKLSAARCARISYAPFDGDASYERELERYDSLVSSDVVHASPLEHQATPDEKVDVRVIDQDEQFLCDFQNVYAQKQLHGNLRGWIQYRKTVPNEAVKG